MRRATQYKTYSVALNSIVLALHCGFLYPALPSPSPSGNISVSLHTPCTISAGSYIFADITVAHCFRESQLQGVIGNNLLSQYNVLFDWKNMDLRLTEHGIPQERWEHPKSDQHGPLLHLIAPPGASPRYLEIEGRAQHSNTNAWSGVTAYGRVLFAAQLGGRRGSGVEV